MSKLKALLVAVVAISAISAVWAALAQAEKAQTLECSVNPCTVTISQDGTGKTAHQVFDAAGSSITCKQVQMKAEMGSSTKVLTTTEVIYGTPKEGKNEGCSFLGQETGVKVNMNGCQFELASLESEEGVQISLVCPGTNRLNFGITGCTVKVGPQGPFRLATPHEITEGHEVTLEVPKEKGVVEFLQPEVEYEATGATCLEQGKKTNGKFTTGNVVAKGETEEGGEANLKWSPTVPPERVHCSVQPCRITITNDGTAKTGHQVFDAAGSSITCRGVHAEATFEGKTTQTLTVKGIQCTEPSFLGQEVGMFVQFNGCGLTVHTEPTGDLGRVTIIDCGGQKIKFGIPGCEVRVPEQQTEFKPITFHNLGTAGSREITIESPQSGKELPAVTYEAEGASCPQVGTDLTNGKFTTGNLIATGEQDNEAATMADLWFE